MTEKWARLIRFVDYGVLPHDLAARYDVDRNLVEIDRELFKRLNTYEQNGLLFTEGDVKFSRE